MDLRLALCFGFFNQIFYIHHSRETSKPYHYILNKFTIITRRILCSFHIPALLSDTIHNSVTLEQSFHIKFTNLPRFVKFIFFVQIVSFHKSINLKCQLCQWISCMSFHLTNVTTVYRLASLGIRFLNLSSG